MRILLASHSSIDDPLGLRRVALGLQAAGHSVQVIDVDTSRLTDARIPTRRIVANAADSAADLPFAAPGFNTGRPGEFTFAALHDDQLAAYRHILRQVLDEQVASFDPQIIHCDHIWIFAHLALESGVPYVTTAGVEELAAENRAERFDALAVQAAENSGRVIAADAQLARGVQERFGDLEGRIVILPGLAQSTEVLSLDSAQALVDIYGEVLDQRLGRRWRA